ncbi:MAG: peptide deformylase [Bacteroidia bacterium]|nr:peptide deformylase [Bacteroidia bacterium]
MILPIVAYGDPTLKQKAAPIDGQDLSTLIADMFETMYNANGVGLAAPQVGRSIRLFVVDAAPLYPDDQPKPPNLKRVFINPVIVEERGEPWGFEEGCLSIPALRQTVYRKPVVAIRYEDEHRRIVEETLDGMLARVVQHEFDHLEGVLFIDRLPPLKKQLVKAKLYRIARGDVECAYPMLVKGRLVVPGAG